MAVAGLETLGQPLAQHYAGGLGGYDLGQRDAQGGAPFSGRHQHQPGLGAELPDAGDDRRPQGQAELPTSSLGRARGHHDGVEAAELSVEGDGARPPAGNVEKCPAPTERTGERPRPYPGVLQEPHPCLRPVHQLQ